MVQDDERALSERRKYCRHIRQAQEKYEAEEFRSARKLLDDCPAEFRGWEWLYLDAKVGSSVEMQASIKSKVNYLAFSRDGERVVACFEGQSTRVWDAWTGEELFSPAVDRIWPLNPSKTQWQRSSVECFDPPNADVNWWEGKGSDENKDCLDYFDLPPYEWRRFVDIENSNGVSAQIDIQSHSAIVSRREKSEGGELAQFELDNVLALALGPDGDRLVVCFSNRLNILDIRRTNTERELIGAHYLVGTIEFSPDGKRLAAVSDVWGTQDDNSFSVWDVVDGRRVSSMDGHDIDKQVPDHEREPGAWGVPGAAAHIRAIAFNQDGTRIVTASFDRTVRIWNAETVDELARIRHECHGLSGNESVAFSPDGKLIALAWASTVMIFDAASGEELFTAPGRSIAFHPDGSQFAVAGEGPVAIFGATKRELIRSLDVNGMHVQYSLNGKVLVALCSEYQAVVHDVQQEQELSRFTVDWGCECLALNSDGQRLAVGNESKITLYDTVTGQCLLSLDDMPAKQLVFTPDGFQLAAVDDRVVLLGTM